MSYIEHRLLCDVLWEDNGLIDVEVQTSIFLEDGLDLTEFDRDVPIIGVSYRPRLLELS